VTPVLSVGALIAGASGLLSVAPAMANSSVVAGTSSSHARTTLHVARTGRDRGSCTAASTPCATLAFALSRAAAGDHVVLEPGTYRENAAANVVAPRLTGLSISSDPAHGGAAGNTIIDATGRTTGLLVEASGVSVRGLTVEGANHEGILAEPPVTSWPSTATSRPAGIAHVAILDNVVKGNDKAYDTKLPPDKACPSSATDLDDCGEAIHLLAVSSSKVIGNDVTGNVGGILVSDGGMLPSKASPSGGTPVGPAAHNLIAYNVSSDNAFDCGITLPGHDSLAVATTGPEAGRPQPKVAGVFGNVVRDNVAMGNGGSGLLDAAPFPGTASYDNTFAGNTAANNGNSGFTLHSHAPFQDVSGIRVVNNAFGPNDLAGDSDAGVTSSTGILLLSVAVPVNIVVRGNTVFGDAIGVARNSKIHVTGNNRFFGVGTPFFVYTPPAP
jgi:hypothetical protein